MTPLTIFVGVGLFYMDGPTLRFQGDAQEGEFDLSSFEGQEVRALAFHTPLPHKPPDLPAFGACYWKSGCPFDHEAQPHRLLAFQSVGVVTHSSGVWRIGNDVFPLGALLGHKCLVAVCPTEWSPVASVGPEGVNLGEEIARLRAMLSSLKVR